MIRSPSPFLRALLVAAVFAGGALAAGVLTRAAPAAPQDCLPVVGCVTTTIPTIPLPTVTLPTLPTPTTTTTTATTSGPPAASTETSATAGSTPATPKEPQVAFAARASVRVRGRGVRRILEVRVRVTKPANVDAQLSRNGRAPGRKRFTARTGSSLLVLRIGRAVKPGAARVTLSYRADSGETSRATYRVRLPR